MTAFAEEFLDRQARRWKPRTQETNSRIVRNDILPAFGGLTVDAITVEQVRDWFAAMSEAGIDPPPLAPDPIREPASDPASFDGLQVPANSLERRDLPMTKMKLPKKRREERKRTCPSATDVAPEMLAT